MFVQARDHAVEASGGCWKKVLKANTGTIESSKLQYSSKPAEGLSPGYFLRWRWTVVDLGHEGVLQFFFDFPGECVGDEAGTIVGVEDNCGQDSRSIQCSNPYLAADTQPPLRLEGFSSSRTEAGTGAFNVACLGPPEIGPGEDRIASLCKRRCTHLDRSLIGPSVSRPESPPGRSIAAEILSWRTQRP